MRLLYLLLYGLLFCHFVFAQGYLQNDGLTNHTTGITINEVSARSNPTDFNADGVTSSNPDKDEFIEIVNTSNININIGGWLIGDGQGNYTFPANTIVNPGKCLVLFTRLASINNFNPGSQNLCSTTDGASVLRLNNSSESVGIRNLNNLYIEVNWGGTLNSTLVSGATLVGNVPVLSAFNSGQSQTRFPDFTGGWIQHPAIPGTVNWSVDGLVTLTNPMGSPGRFTGTDITLPVEMTSFTATAADHRIRLRWQTASEVENLGFEVLRSLARTGPWEIIDSFNDNPDLRGAGTSSERHDYTYDDVAVFQNQLYWYKLSDVDVQGNRSEHGPLAAMALNSDQVASDETQAVWPLEFRLSANYPNPFNLQTTIPFAVPALTQGAEQLVITVHDITGRKIRELFNGLISSGNFQARWDGKDDQQRVVAAGVYFLHLACSSYQNSIKMVLLK